MDSSCTETGRAGRPPNRRAEVDGVSKPGVGPTSKPRDEREEVPVLPSRERAEPDEAPAPAAPPSGSGTGPAPLLPPAPPLDGLATPGPPAPAGVGGDAAAAPSLPAAPGAPMAREDVPVPLAAAGSLTATRRRVIWGSEALAAVGSFGWGRRTTVGPEGRGPGAGIAPATGLGTGKAPGAP